MSCMLGLVQKQNQKWGGVVFGEMWFEPQLAVLREQMWCQDQTRNGQMS